jgi:hypothetical protein
MSWLCAAKTDLFDSQRICYDTVIGELTRGARRPKAHANVAQSLKPDYEEAREILGSSSHSARCYSVCVQKLCIEPGKTGKNISEIGSLWRKGFRETPRPSQCFNSKVARWFWRLSRVKRVSCPDRQRHVYAGRKTVRVISVTE